MSDFFARLAERQLSETVGVRPRLASRFAPSPIASERPTSERLPADPGLEIPPQTRRREQSTMEPDTSPRTREPNRQIPVPSDPSEGDRIDARDEPQFARAIERHVVATVHDARDHTPEVQSMASPVEVQTQRRTPVSTNVPQGTAVDGKPSAGMTAGDVESPAGARHTESGRRTPLVSPRHDGATEARPRAIGHEVPVVRAEEESSVVHVSIGRIDVTAVTHAAPAKRAGAPRKPALSLDDYLTRRHGSRR